MPRSQRARAAPAARPAADPRDVALRAAAKRRANAPELFERAVLAHKRARNCLLRAHGLLRQTQRYMDEEPLAPLFPPILDWLP